MTVTAHDLDMAVSGVVSALRPAVGRDWSVQAGSLDWDCRATAEHVGDCLLAYATQVAEQPDGRYVRFLATADKDATAGEVLEFAEAGGRVLVAVLRAAAADVRAYHPSGMADPEGFAAMGCTEVLLHGDDIARGLGVVLSPDREICRAVLGRLFPDTPAGLASADPWQALCWATGRRALPGYPQLREWHWHAAPLEDLRCVPGLPLCRRGQPPGRLLAAGQLVSAGGCISPMPRKVGAPGCLPASPSCLTVAA